MRVERVWGMKMVKVDRGKGVVKDVSVDMGRGVVWGEEVMWLEMERGENGGKVK